MLKPGWREELETIRRLAREQRRRLAEVRERNERLMRKVERQLLELAQRGRRPTEEWIDEGSLVDGRRIELPTSALRTASAAKRKS